MTTVSDALKSARRTMATSSNDWSTNADFAWLYGLLVGWTDDDGNDDVSTLRLLAARFGWTVEDVRKLRQMRAAVKEATR